jgi:hypothetical protein
VDLRWQIGGTTTTDDVDDDNRTNILGGGLSAGSDGRVRDAAGPVAPAWRAWGHLG